MPGEMVTFGGGGEVWGGGGGGGGGGGTSGGGGGGLSVWGVGGVCFAWVGIVFRVQFVCGCPAFGQYEYFSARRTSDQNPCRLLEILPDPRCDC